MPCTWTGGVKDGTAKGHNESGCRSRIRVRGERRLCANAGDNNQRNTDIRGQGQSAAAMAQRRVIRSPVVGLLQLQQNNNWTEMPRGDDHTRVQSNLMFQPLIESEADREAGADYPPHGDHR